MKALAVALCVLVTFSVASFGAVQVWSESVVEIGTAVLLLFWACLALLNRSVEVRWNPLNWPILAFCAIGAAQLLFHATAYPFLTRTELLRAVTCWAFFFLATQAFQSRGDFNALTWFLILLSFGVSLLGIIQHFTAGDEIYWMPQLAAGGKPFGPFVNRNHFAGFVELTLPTGLALLMLRGIRREQAPLMIVLTLVPISAVVLASSRGGIICVGLEICGLAAFRLIRQRAERIRVIPLVVALAAGGILIGWMGVGHAADRFLPSHTGVPLGKRLSMTRGALNIFLAHPVSGAGLGTTIAVYPRYETMYDGRVVDHVHNDYAEALAETGVLGGLCGLAFLILLFRNARRRLLAEQGHFSRALHAGALAAVGGLLFHSFVDFNLHIFSNALLFLLQAFVATAPALPASRASRAFRSASDNMPRVAIQAP